MADLTHISAEQRDALGKLASALPSDAYLAGGIAVSARLGHRPSLDLDVFMTTSDPTSSIDALAAIEAALIRCGRTSPGADGTRAPWGSRCDSREPADRTRGFGRAPRRRRGYPWRSRPSLAQSMSSW
jgi:hypothetical protein